MAITRVNPSDWALNDRLTRAQITQLDKNMSYTIDSVAGHTDTIKSDLTVDSTGSIIGATGSALIVEDPYDISIADGYAEIDARIIGLNNPINFGYVTQALSPTGTTALAAVAWESAQVIELTGLITANVTLTVPAIYGYTKLFVGGFNTFFNHKVTITTGSGEVVILGMNQNVLVYCNGVDVYEVARHGHGQLVDQAMIKFNCNGIAPTSGALTVENPDVSYIRYGGKVGLVSGATSNLILGDISYDTLIETDFPIHDTSVTGKIVFLDVRANDKFEINLACGVQRTTSTSNTLTWIAPYVLYGDFYTAANDKYFEPANKQGAVLQEAMIPTNNGLYHYGAGNTIFIAPFDGTYEFKTFMYYDMPGSSAFFPVTAFGPLQLVVKQWRF